MPTNKAYIALGSNIGERADSLAKARDGLSVHGTLEKASPIYQTKPMYVEDQNLFLNQVILIATKMDVHALFDACQTLEKTIGRIRRYENGPREIDIDILSFNDLILTQADLTLPHPRIPERVFVLKPLCDIDKNWQHPILNQTASELLALHTNSTDGCIIHEK